MSLRQDMQHMLMIAIQRQYVPSALQLDHNSPVKIKASSGGYENDEELTQDPEDFVQEMKEKEETISATENNNAATPLNHTRNGMHTEYYDSEKNKENAAFEDDQGNQGGMTNTMTPQKFFNTPFGKNKRIQRFDSNIKKKGRVSPSVPALTSRVACQKKLILGLEEELVAAKATIVRLNKKMIINLYCRKKWPSLLKTRIQRLKGSRQRLRKLMTFKLEI